MDELKKTWMCPNCSNTSRRGPKSDDTPTRKQHDSITNATPVSELSATTAQPNTSRAATPPGKHPSLSNPSTDGPYISYDMFGQLLDTKLGEMKASLSAELKQMMRNEMTLSFDKLKADFTETTDFLDSRQNELCQKLATADAAIKHLEEEKISLHSDLSVLMNRVVTLDKASRCCNLEIQCVPEKRNENLISLFQKICNVIKSPLTSDTQIRTIRRVAKMNLESTRPRNILVILLSERHRDVLISAFKKYNRDNRSNPLNSTNIDIAGDKQNIYLAEHLSKECKELHAEARRIAKERSFQYTWVKYNRVYCRKDDNSSAILIKSRSCLDKLK
ncbi:hypothetical protein ABMA28_010774 [Loxostege sticticalis]|uniref:FP protein C-terminal domain-containing protein n=1 Tax=Loxostege sticticalis TaxID=481309 RepID=A0ABD0S7B3_LOXSC